MNTSLQVAVFWVVTPYVTARHYNPEDRVLNLHRHENPKSCPFLQGCTLTKFPLFIEMSYFHVLGLICVLLEDHILFGEMSAETLFVR
jgi:hypothetical protein